MSLLFIALVFGSTFFASLSLFETSEKRGHRRVARWSPTRRLSVRARLRRAS